MISALLLLLALAVMPGGQSAAPDRDVAAAELAAARALYAAASYEEALDRLARVGTHATFADQVDTYRALCLLALGRTRESERVVETLLLRNPRFVPDEREVSPRLVQVFRAVRARLLPVQARTLYTAGRASFDAGKYAVAVSQFREVLELLEHNAAPDSSVSDLRVLTEGFLRQAEVRSGLGPKPAARADGSGGPVYSVLDRDVIGAVETSRPVPIMDTPRGLKPYLYQGLVEIVIDERGRVESAEMRRSIAAGFDEQIVEATKEWRFQPATRNGQPVKYRRFYEIIGHTR
jgi:TonB family protein